MHVGVSTLVTHYRSEDVLETLLLRFNDDGSPAILNLAYACIVEHYTRWHPYKRGNTFREEDTRYAGDPDGPAKDKCDFRAGASGERVGVRLAAAASAG